VREAIKVRRALLDGLLKELIAETAPTDARPLAALSSGQPSDEHSEKQGVTP
jgi:hypothetical protein